MPGCLDCETCFYCGRFLSPRHEHDHFPIPRRAGGTATVPACIDCHDLKDRFPVFAWPVHSLVPVFNGCESRPMFELLVALADSMPHVYRSRVPMDPLPVELRPLADWSTDELVETVLAANTTEARLYLANVVACSWDWSDDRERHPFKTTPQRPRQDSNLRPAD